MCADDLSVPIQVFQRRSVYKGHALVSLIILVLAVSLGCRAMGRFGKSRQAIAARKLSRQGQQAMHDGSWGVAEGLFNDALDVSEHDDRAHWGLAESLWNRDQKEQALVHMEKAVRLSADDPVLLHRLGRMYADLGRYEQAKRQCDAALAADRHSAEIWVLQGDCRSADGDDSAALSAYHRALAIQPDHSNALIRAAEVYGRNQRHDRLLATLDRLADHLGHRNLPAEAELMRGIAMRNLGRHGEAMRSFAAAASKKPDSAEPHLEIASIAMTNGDVATARQALRQAVSIDPAVVDDREAWTPFQTPSFAPIVAELSADALRR